MLRGFTFSTRCLLLLEALTDVTGDKVPFGMAAADKVPFGMAVTWACPGRRKAEPRREPGAGCEPAGASPADLARGIQRAGRLWKGCQQRCQA